MQFFSDNAWDSVTPRAWQEQAYPIIVSALGEGVKSCVQAVMGAGKSVLIAEVAATADLEDGEVVVISTPTRALVEQLHETVSGRMGDAGMYYTYKKDTGNSVIIACNASMVRLAEDLDELGKRVALWIADEAHRTQTEQILGIQHLLNAKSCLGFTATPYRADEEENLCLYERLIFKYGPRQALRDGVVVPWRIAHHHGADYESLDEVCAAWIEQAVFADEIGPLVCDAFSISDAENFAFFLTERGIRSRAVHSEMPRDEVHRYIEELRVGEIHVLVHVALLREGVNLPWLKGLVLRRDVASRVGFAQQVGRVLRSYPGKEIAVVFDPHDLFSRHALNYEACLGAGLTPDMDLDEILEQIRAQNQDENPRRRGRGMWLGDDRVLTAKTLDLHESLLRRLCNALETCEMMPPATFPNGPWRSRHASPSQLRHLAQKGSILRDMRDSGRSRRAPQHVHESLSRVWREAPRLRRGAVSDLVRVCDALIKAGGWPQEASALVGF